MQKTKIENVYYPACKELKVDKSLDYLIRTCLMICVITVCLSKLTSPWTT